WAASRTPRHCCSPSIPSGSGGEAPGSRTSDSWRRGPRRSSWIWTGWRSRITGSWPYWWPAGRTMSAGCGLSSSRSRRCAVAWPDLDLSRCPNTAEVQDAIARGILHLRYDLPPISVPADRCWTRADYEQWIYCDPLAVSIIPAEQLMTKLQMQNFAEVPPPPYPMDFRATHDIEL